MRPETDAMKFGDDWTGVFIRGDNAFVFAETLRAIYNEYSDIMVFFHRETIEKMIKLLESCNEHTSQKTPQEMKSFKNCKCYKEKK